MKISDLELLQLIWENQMGVLARRTTHHYIGGSYGLCEDTDFWFQSASSEHRISRDNVTTAIGKPQLMARIRSLFAQGLIASAYGEELLTFYIPGETSLAAFKAARRWMLENGIPEGSEDGRSRSVKMPETEFSRLLDQCREYLLIEFPRYHPPADAVVGKVA